MALALDGSGGVEEFELYFSIFLQPFLRFSPLCRELRNQKSSGPLCVTRFLKDGRHQEHPLKA